MQFGIKTQWYIRLKNIKSRLWIFLIGIQKMPNTGFWNWPKKLNFGTMSYGTFRWLRRVAGNVWLSDKNLETDADPDSGQIATANCRFYGAKTENSRFLKNPGAVHSVLGMLCKHLLSLALSMRDFHMASYANKILQIGTTD